MMVWLSNQWRDRRAFRWGVWAIAGSFLALAVAYALLARTLPDANGLLDYEPPLPTVVRGMDGDIIHSYARERRVQLQYGDLPKQLIQAYLAAEDKTFFSHNGVDLGGLVGAVIDYASKMGSGERAKGGSTITQQVAKNILVGNEYSISRKVKEMMLARKIEGVLTKQQILELYLNEIALGRRSFGVQAAARAYFDKDVGDLELHEAAYLSILPKAPEVYSRAKNFVVAKERRDFVLGQMVENEFITAAQGRAAQARPLGIVESRPQRESVDAGYFLEEVRRQLIDKFGETAETGKNSVYGGGLWVRTSLDQEIQDGARDALRKGLLRYHGSRGWRGPIATIDFADGPWQSQLASSNIGINYRDWRVGVVTQRSGGTATIGFADGQEAPLAGLPSALEPGHVVAVAPQGNGFRVRTIPDVSGGIVVEAPQSGRIVAMQGGFDSRLGSFNRATQANRQPGSTIKPFVYATGLDNGMTPATQIENGRYCYYQGARLGEKCFRGGRSGSFPMRYGLEQSQNIITIQIAMQSGMKNVTKTIEQVGIGSYDPFPAFALGAGDTTVVKMTNAYSALANNGRQHAPTVIDFVQDRRGKVIWRADDRDCTGCNMADWDGKPMPRLGMGGKQTMDARTAYQTTHMLEGVVTRGTGKVLNGLDLPLFGKTGTTTDSKDVWFVGGTQQYVAGVYVGFDTPRGMGGYAQGGTIAAPILRDLIVATRDRWVDDPLIAPAGVRMVRVDRRTGKRVFGGTASEGEGAAVIWEAFKPDTEPPRATRRDAVAAKRDEILALVRRGSRENASRPRPAPPPPARDEPDFVEDQGGLY